MTINGQNIQWPEASNFVVGDRGTMALGVKDVQDLIPDTIVATEDFETDPISGSGTWILTGTSPHSGLRCLRSAVIGNNSDTLYTFIPPGGGETHLRFWHRVSSELNFDFFQVYKDSVAGPNLLFQLSGTANIWQQLTIPVTGVTSVIFRYVKDGSSTSGLDTAFIDDLEWIIPGVAAIQIYEPFHLNNNNEVKVTVANFPAYINLNCDDDSVTVCQGTDPWIISGTVELGATTLAALETVTVLQGTSPWVVTGTVNIGTINFPYDYPEDSPHTTGDVGAFVLGVRNDSGGSLVNNDLDYAPLQLDSIGRLRVTTRSDKRTGCYYLASPNSSLTTAADAATSGRFWLTNTSALFLVKLLEVRFTCNITSLLDLGSALPTVTMERMTFTGTPSGTLVTPARRDSTDPANTGTFRSAATGMVITAGAAIKSFHPVSQNAVGGLLAVNATAAVPVEQVFRPRDDSGDIVIRQNEGVVFRQASAGAATEARIIQIDLVWEEYSV